VGSLAVGRYTAALHTRASRRQPLLRKLSTKLQWRPAPAAAIHSCSQIPDKNKSELQRAHHGTINVAMGQQVQQPTHTTCDLRQTCKPQALPNSKLGRAADAVGTGKHALLKQGNRMSCVACTQCTKPAAQTSPTCALSSEMPGPGA
jgi:hypothetical protein